MVYLSPGKWVNKCTDMLLYYHYAKKEILFSKPYVYREKVDFVFVQKKNQGNV